MNQKIIRPLLLGYLFFFFGISVNCLYAADDWTQKTPSSKPSARTVHNMAYIGGDQVLLFGGYDGTYDGETWLYDLSATTWTNKSPSVPPSARYKHAMAYIGGDQVLLFGGYDGALDGETWIYDLSNNTWTNKTPSVPPSAREQHGMAYIGGDQVLLFGGTDGSYLSETWLYDLSDNTWTNKTPNPKPSARALHRMAYIGGDQVLLFGGEDASGLDDNTWLYDLSDDTWTNKSPASSPSARRSHAIAYIGGDQVLLFGGYDGANDDETWIYDLSDDNWTQDSNTSQPSARYSHRLSETSMDGSSYLVLFGGNDGTDDDETWTFGGGDISLPVELSSFSASVERSGAAVLKWVTESEIDNLGFILERRSNGEIEEWKEIANYIDNPELQGQGSVTYRTEYSYTDKTVEEGKTYDYSLADVSYTGVKEYHTLSVLGFTVTKPIPGKYSVSSAYPNPFNPETTISFNLPETQVVSVAIYDITGRIVTELANTEYNAGSHSIIWNASEMGSGMYFYRLKAGSFAATGKLALMK